RLMPDRRHGASKRDSRLRKHLYPQPRLAVGAWLAEQRLATAMMDISDGLSSDLPRLCDSSGVGARIETKRMPVARLSGLDSKKYNSLELAVDGGDDYELLFTVAPKDVSRIPRSVAGTSLTLIGRVARETGILLVSESRKEIPLTRKGWDPFRS